MTDPATLPPIPEDEATELKAAKPPHGADDGKSGGGTGGSRGEANFSQASHGINAQTGQPAGTENERSAPGISTDKRSDDTR